MSTTTSAWLCLISVQVSYIVLYICRCDKGGRVVGGMGALPGFGWWPIKAYRPCPALISAGMQYKR